jgi:hypothetical protein
MTKTFTCAFERGFVGADVARAQQFLNNEVQAGLTVDGVYGGRTADAVKVFQTRNGLPQDGLIAGPTLTAARDKGLVVIDYVVEPDQEGIGWPKKPTDLTQPNSTITQSLFGTFQFQFAPVPGNAEHINILGNWVAENIVTVNVPQLRGMVIPINEAHATLSSGNIQCHTLARQPILDLFAAWDAAGLMSKMLTWDGSWVPRLIRGKTNPIPANLSNHSWGSTFDINEALNKRGTVPALMGARGCLREFVSIANEIGFYWGGHFAKRDGMHFELARL